MNQATTIPEEKVATSSTVYRIDHVAACPDISSHKDLYETLQEKFVNNKPTTGRKNNSISGKTVSARSDANCLINDGKQRV